MNLDLPSLFDKLLKEEKKANAFPIRKYWGRHQANHRLRESEQGIHRVIQLKALVIGGIDLRNRPAICN